MENDNLNKASTREKSNEKIILFVIGVLVGAVISTAAFVAYAKTIGVNSSSENGQSQMQGGGTPPEMPSGSSSNGQGGTPPDMPGNNSQNSSSSNS